jgi:hypothetical protein
VKALRSDNQVSPARGGVDATRLLGQRLGPSRAWSGREEAAGLPAHRRVEVSAEHAGWQGRTPAHFGHLGRTAVAKTIRGSATLTMTWANAPTRLN